MKKFQYKAKTRTGANLGGVLEAATQEDAVAKLRSEGYFVTNIKEVSTSTTRLFRPRGKVKPKLLAILCRQFAIQIEAGLSLVQSLRLLEEQTADPRVRDAFREIRVDVASGSSLTKSLEKHSDLFPYVFINLVAAGELAGALPTVLERLAIYYEREDELRKKVSEALMYPAVISVFAFFVVLALLFFVLPMFAGIFAQFGGELPALTAAVLRFRDWLITYWYAVLSVVIGLIVFLRWYGKTERGRYRFDYLTLRLPVVGNLVQMVIYSRFCRTLSLLLDSGISMIHSLELLESLIDNVVIRSALKDARFGVERGQGLTAPLRESGVFPPMLMQMAAVGEQSGNLERTLVHLADYYDREVSYAVTSLTKILEPIVMLFLAVVVLFIAVSVLLPMMGMISQF